MTDEQTAIQPPEGQSRESAGMTITSELAKLQEIPEELLSRELPLFPGDQAQIQATEQKTPTQSRETTKQSETQKAATGQESSILTGKEPEEQAEQKKEEPKPEVRAPEEYADFTVPDAFKLEGQDLTDFKSFAKEQDLSQEQAQKVLDFAGPKIKQMIEQPYKAWNEIQSRWQAEVKADPEIGGTKYEQSVKEAGNVFVPGESNPFIKSDVEAKSLREALKATGAGNNPAIVRLFVKMGRLLAEPENLTGKPAPHSRQEALLNSMYPTMNDSK